MAPGERIVSLLPSATEIVYALGLGERVVGISHSCDYPPGATGKPRLTCPRFEPSGLSSGQIDRAVRRTLRQFGSVYEVDAERLAVLRPDLVLTQAVCDVCAVSTAAADEAIAGLEPPPRLVSLDAHDLNAIFEGVREVGRATGKTAAADELVTRLRDRAATLAARVAGRPRPRVLALEWLDPPFVPGHWVPELVALAGGDLVAGLTGRASYAVSWDELAGADPDVLVVMPCGLDLPAARADADGARARLEAVAGRAIRAGRAYVSDASAYFSRPGPRAVDGLAILAAVLHPEVVADTVLAGRVARWP